MATGRGGGRLPSAAAVIEVDFVAEFEAVEGIEGVGGGRRAGTHLHLGFLEPIHCDWFVGAANYERENGFEKERERDGGKSDWDFGMGVVMGKAESGGVV